MYKLLPNDLITNQPSKCVLFVEQNLYIPFDPANTDYQVYLKWIAEGNTPLPADEQGASA